MKIGLEKEFFLLRDGKPQAIVGLAIPCDECGWLVEARGEPHYSIVDAVFSLKASIYKIEKSVITINSRAVNTSEVFALSDEPIMKVDKAVKLKCARNYAKGLIQYQNLYGFECHKNALSESTAGVHVSFTEQYVIYNKDGTKYEHNTNFDWPQIFVKLDKAFAEEIKAAKRRPGFYELKNDGRVEYRSLPSNINLDKLMDVLS